jgi:hypothetical protein
VCAPQLARLTRLGLRSRLPAGIERGSHLAVGYLSAKVFRPLRMCPIERIDRCAALPRHSGMPGAGSIETPRPLANRCNVWETVAPVSPATPAAPASSRGNRPVCRDQSDRVRPEPSHRSPLRNRPDVVPRRPEERSQAARSSWVDFPGCPGLQKATDLGRLSCRGSRDQIARLRP